MVSLERSVGKIHLVWPPGLSGLKYMTIKWKIIQNLLFLTQFELEANKESLKRSQRDLFNNTLFVP